jgi:DNA-binding IclR family transcriptional regulator
VPLHATSSGKAFLAYLEPAERDGLLGERLEGFTATTVTDRAMLEKELAAAREDGYAVCVGELEESLYGASAAVLSEQGRPLAIVSVWGPERRVPTARLAAIGVLTVAAAAQIRELLR